MSSKLWKSIATAACLVAIAHPCLAETRTAWGIGNALKNSTQLDDNALMEVSGRGSIDESAVKALQGKGKLAEYLAAAGQGQSGLNASAAESAEKQAIQTQLKMASGSAQAVMSSIQITAVVTSATNPVTFAPVMSAPFFGLPLMPH